MLGPGAGKQLGVIRQVKFDAGPQLQAAGQIPMAAAKEHPRAGAAAGGGVDGALQGGGVQGGAIAHRAVIQDVEDPARSRIRRRAAQAGRQRGAQGRGRRPAGAENHGLPSSKGEPIHRRCRRFNA